MTDSWQTIRTWCSTLLFWSYFVVSNALWWLGSLVLAAVTLPFDHQRRRALHLYTCAWGYHYVSVLPLWSPTWSGRSRIVSDQTYMLVSNHQSWGDILVLFGLFKHYKWVSKAIVFRVPFIGWNMTMNQYIPLKRGDAKSIAEMLEHCRVHLKQGSSIMMFPEGSRSADGRIKPFKHGAFTLARELGIPVVPIVIDGSLKALPKHGLMMRTPWGLPVRVRVLEPVDVTIDSLESRIMDVRQQMITTLADMRGLSEAEVDGTVSPPGSG
ncbi:MAG: lysophospholipid acyltransferase family protein [Myxococcota bacterium]|nr:lysophospholipid acyltransferase family protein [Myxococcota bacterium]